MKTQYYILFVLILGLSTVNELQSQTVQDQLIGTWSFNYEASYSKITPKIKAKLNTLNSNMHLRIENTYRGRKVTYNIDGSYLQELKDGRKTSGTWQLTNDGNTLLLIDSRKKIHKQRIEYLNQGQLVMIPEANKKGILLFSKLYFLKN